MISDPNENYNKLEYILTQGNDRFFPMRQKRFNKYKHKLNPWMTKGIMESIKFRDRLYKKLKCTTENSAEYLTYKTNLSNYNKILQKMIRNAKFSFHSDLFTKFKADYKKTWQHINDILCRKRCSKESPDFFIIKNNRISVKQTIADSFNMFFY